MLWVVGAGFLFVWFILKFLLHKGGFIHVLLLTAISLFVVQFAAYRKTRYQKLSSGR
jgi:Flp pilus assembly protein TadB